jgi:hypothetical protein
MHILGSALVIKTGRSPLHITPLHFVASMRQMATDRRPYTLPSYQDELRHAFSSATRRISKSYELLKPSGC